MSLHGKQATLVIVEHQSLLSELLQQRLDLSILKLNDLLLPLIDHGAEGSEQNVPGLEQEGHVQRRKSLSFQSRHVKSSGGDARL